MARKLRNSNLVSQTFTLACGASDADNLVDAIVPSPNATLLQVTATTKTAGTGTGTFGLQVKYGESTPTAVGDASATTFINADGAAGTIHGSFTPNAAAVKGQEGAHLNISTVKAGTVSGNATLIIMLLWQL